MFTTWATFHLLSISQEFEEVRSIVHGYLLTCTGGSISDNKYLHRNLYIYTPNDTHHIAFIENTVLWNVPAMVFLLVSSAAMFVMVIKLASRVYWRSNYEKPTEGDPFMKAVKFPL